MNRRIVYFQYTNAAAYPPLERSSRLLADAGWDVLILGLLKPDTEALRFPVHEHITERHTFNATSGWRLRLHYVWFAAWVLGWTLRWRAGWVYASDVLACPVALLLSLVPGIRVIYHEHDEPAMRPGVSAWGQRLVRRLAARRADIRVLPNAGRASYFERTVSGGRPVLRVWNCPSVTEVAPPREDVRPPGPLRVVYSGSVTPERLPLTLLRAMARIPGRIRLVVAGYATIGRPRYIEELQQIAAQLGIASDIEFVGVLPRHRLREVWDLADVGLAINPMESTSNNSTWMVGASNKPFDYMANGLALLVSDTAEWREAFVTPGYAVACDPRDPESLANALHWLAEHPAETRALGANGRRQIGTEWNYEEQFAPVMAEMEALAAPQPASEPLAETLSTPWRRLRTVRGVSMQTAVRLPTPTRLAVKRVLFPGLDLHTRCRYRYLPRMFRAGPIDTLDAGCGNGALAYAAYKLGNRVLGITVRDDEVQRNQEYFGSLLPNCDRLQFRQMNIYDLPKLGRRFDQIVCTETLEHITRDADVVASFAEALRPGGVLHLCCPFALHPSNNLGRVADPENGGHVRDGYTLETYHRLLDRAGLTIVACGGLGSPLLVDLDRRLSNVRGRYGDAAALPLFLASLPLSWLDRPNPRVPLSLYVQATRSA